MLGYHPLQQHQACPCPGDLHSPQLSGSSWSLSSYGLSLPPLFWALERRIEGDERETPVIGGFHTPQDSAATAWSAVLLWHSSQMAVGRVGLSSSSVVMSLSDRVQDAMQVPRPQDWQRHGCCREGLQGHYKFLTQLQACFENGHIHSACDQSAVCTLTAENMPVLVHLWIIESLVSVQLTRI